MASLPASNAAAAAAVPIFCSHIPREILQVAGFEPVEILSPEEPDQAGRHACALCDNICSWVRHLIGRLAASDFPLIVVPTSCDAMAKLHDALLAELGARRVFRLEVPRNADAAAVAYLAGQYERLFERLGVTRLAEAALQEPKERAKWGEPRSAPDPTPLREPRPTRVAAGPAAPGTVRVGLAGSVYPEAQFRGALEAAGAQVQVVRRCGMQLPGSPRADLFESGDIATFCTRLAAHYLHASVCPRMMGARYADFVASQVAERHLTALVVPVLKFCDLYHLSVDRVSRRLPDGFPILLVEGDLTVGFGEQTITRLEAFVERLEDRDGSTRAASPRVQGADRRLAVGVDVGSTQVKAVLMDDGRRIACTFIRPTTGRMVDSANDAVAQLLLAAGIGRERVATVGVTGYGRKAVACDAVATEISCHARGVSRFFPEPATIVDVGGQDSKVIVTDGRGRVVRFTMNDKCAAGTGRFIDAMVRTLDLDFQRFSALSLEADAEVAVTSMCSVFAESEVISLGARGEPLAGIARGINASIARRVAGMVRRVEGVPPFVLTGGVSQIPGFVRELERDLDTPVRVYEHALHAGAIGAAMLALEGAS